VNVLAAGVTALVLCAPPRGPGDTRIHARDLTVVHISCATARRVALACVRFTYGHAGTCVVGSSRWHCRSNADGLRSRQVCVTGRRRLTIVWVD
jgi:hypothetical protein